jgi:DNA-binding response OmpR family regulator
LWFGGGVAIRVLLVEDHARLAGFIVKGLAAAGFTTDHVATLEEALAALATARYDEIALDLGLPDGDGLDLIKALRERQDSVPILVLTARDGLRDKVTGLNAGADDYLLKPFEMEELVARLRALLRRPGGILGTTLTCGKLSLETIDRQAYVDGEPLVLSRKELGLLELLMRRVGRVVTKDTIDERLYGFGESASRNSIEVLVHRLRRRLSDAGAAVQIHTLRGAGYMFSDKPSAED